MGRWTRERHAQEAAKKANEAARAHQESAKTGGEPAAEQTEPEPEKAPDFRPITPGKSPRSAAMEEIISRHEAGATQAESPEPETQKPEAEPQKAEQTPAAAVPAAAEVAAAPEVAVAEPVKTVRVKVDGEEFDVPQSDVDAAGGVHAYQRDRASDNRLRKINESLAEAKRTQAATAEWLQKLVQARPAEPTLTDDAFISSKIDVIRYGTPEESATAFREAISRFIPKVDQNQILNQAVIYVNRQAAINKFRQDFQEISSNPMLIKLAATIENEALAALPRETVENLQVAAQFDWSKFYGNIGNQIRGVIGRPSQLASTPTTAASPEVGAAASATSTTSQSPDKAARKASITTLPTAAARAELPAEAKPETREEIVRHMRKSRGLPVD